MKWQLYIIRYKNTARSYVAPLPNLITLGTKGVIVSEFMTRSKPSPLLMTAMLYVNPKRP